MKVNDEVVTIRTAFFWNYKMILQNQYCETIDIIKKTVLK